MLVTQTKIFYEMKLIHYNGLTFIYGVQKVLAQVRH